MSKLVGILFSCFVVFLFAKITATLCKGRSLCDFEPDEPEIELEPIIEPEIVDEAQEGLTIEGGRFITIKDELESNLDEVVFSVEYAPKGGRVIMPELTHEERAHASAHKVKEAKRLYFESDLSATEIANKCRVTRKTLYNWRARFNWKKPEIYAK